MNYKEYKQKQKEDLEVYKQKLKADLDEFKEKLKIKLEKFKLKTKAKTKNNKKIKGGVIGDNEYVGRERRRKITSSAAPLKAIDETDSDSDSDSEYENILITDDISEDEKKEINNLIEMICDLFLKSFKNKYNYTDKSSEELIIFLLEDNTQFTNLIDIIHTLADVIDDNLMSIIDKVNILLYSKGSQNNIFRIPDSDNITDKDIKLINYLFYLIKNGIKHLLPLIKSNKDITIDNTSKVRQQIIDKNKVLSTQKEMLEEFLKSDKYILIENLYLCEAVE